MSDDLTLDSDVRTDIGRGRDNNEDAAGRFEPDDVAVLAERGALYVVADGMGGHQAGEVASNYAVKKILHAYYALPWAGPQETLGAAVQAANAEIHEEGQRNPERADMGTTVVAAVVRGNEAVIAHAGDSRAYLLRDGALRQLTRDHTWVADRLADGTLTPEQAIDHPNRNVITRNLGHRAEVQPDITSVRLRSGDRLLLCSDGLWGMLRDEQIAPLLAHGSAADAARALIDAANEAGGRDNIGVAVVGIGPQPPPRDHGGALTPPAVITPPATVIGVLRRESTQQSHGYDSVSAGAPHYDPNSETRRVGLIRGRRGLHGARLFVVALAALVPLALVGAFALGLSHGGTPASKTPTAAAASASASAAVDRGGATTSSTAQSTTTAVAQATVPEAVRTPVARGNSTPAGAVQPSKPTPNPTTASSPTAHLLLLTEPDPNAPSNAPQPAGRHTYCTSLDQIIDAVSTATLYQVASRSSSDDSGNLGPISQINLQQAGSCYTVDQISKPLGPGIYRINIADSSGSTTLLAGFFAVDTSDSIKCDHRTVSRASEMAPDGLTLFCAEQGDTPTSIATFAQSNCREIDSKVLGSEIFALNPGQLQGDQWALVPDLGSDNTCYGSNVASVNHAGGALTAITMLPPSVSTNAPPAPPSVVPTAPVPPQAPPVVVTPRATVPPDQRPVTATTHQGMLERLVSSAIRLLGRFVGLGDAAVPS